MEDGLVKARGRLPLRKGALRLTALPRAGHRRAHLGRRGVRARARLCAHLLRGAGAAGRARAAWRLTRPRSTWSRCGAATWRRFGRWKRPPPTGGSPRWTGARARRCTLRRTTGRWARRGLTPQCLHFTQPRPAQVEAARFLLEERGAEVNQQDRHLGWTPLHRAARMCVPPSARPARRRRLTRRVPAAGRTRARSSIWRCSSCCCSTGRMPPSSPTRGGRTSAAAPWWALPRASSTCAPTRGSGGSPAACGASSGRWWRSTRTCPRGGCSGAPQAHGRGARA